MKKEDLFESLNGIDPQLLERSEKNVVRRTWKSIAVIAACFCLIAAVAAANREKTVPLQMQENSLPGVEPQPMQTQDIALEVTPSTEISEEKWDIIYNTETQTGRAYFMLPEIPGYFTETLNTAELEALCPTKSEQWMGFSGFAGFDGEGRVVYVYLTIGTTLPDSGISVTISESPMVDCVAIPNEAELSYCGNVEYQVFESTVNGILVLNANAQIDGKYVEFYLHTASENEATAKADFKAVLQCFALDSDGIKLAAVTAEEIPEWFDLELTWIDAMEEEDFGAFMLRELPFGFTEENIRRYKNQNYDYLFGLWTRNYDEIRWKVSYFKETDVNRLTSVSDRENYDLSLYPIPRAESVPEELREIVDDPIFDAQELTLEVVWARAYQIGDIGDSDGWRIEFTVRYGDILIEIDTKGVDPQWLYEQLMTFCKG